MSADNYMLIRADGDRFAVTMEFASNDMPGQIDVGKNIAPRFSTLLAAIIYASEQPTEYGFHMADDVKATARKLDEAATEAR